MSNPIDDLERERSMEEMGMFGFRIYKGARSEGASRSEALAVTAAWFHALMQTGGGGDEDATS